MLEMTIERADAPVRGSTPFGVPISGRIRDDLGGTAMWPDRAKGGNTMCGEELVREDGNASVSRDTISLAERLACGDPQAIDALYRQHRDGLRRFFLRSCGSDALAQEMAQEVWCKVIRAVHCNGFHAYSSFSSYLYRIARNQLIDWYRRKGISPEVESSRGEQAADDAPELQDPGAADPERICGDRQRVKAVLAAVAALPEVQRATLLMYLETGMSYREIAEAMGTNRETVKSRLRYARRILREQVLDE